MREKDEEEQLMVVAQLKLARQNAEIPYSCISSSPDSRLVVMGGQDTVRIVSVSHSGLKEVRSINISQFFQLNRAAPRASDNFRDLFTNANAPNMNAPNIPVNISDVSWSICQTLDDDTHISAPKSTDSSSPPKANMDNLPDFTFTRNDPFEAIFSLPGDLRMADDSLISVAGSNGVVLVWRACDLLRGLSDTNRNQNEISKQYYGNNQVGRMASSDQSSWIGYPEAVLAKHSKEAKVAFHPRVPGLLLTSSLDGTANLWERTAEVEPAQNQAGGSKWNWLNALSTAHFDNAAAQSFSWKVKRVFKPNRGKLREIKWNPFHDDLFAVVSSDGSLVVYHTVIEWPIVRIHAHGLEATTLDWHPSKPYLIATGGVDKKVKVFDLQADIEGCLQNMDFQERSQQSERGLAGSNTTFSPRSKHEQGLDHSYHGAGLISGDDSSLLRHSTHGFTVSGSTSMANFADNAMLTRGQVRGGSKHTHELSISAPVEKLRWRPPKRAINPAERTRYLHANSTPTDRHEDMFAVTTTGSGASGGSGKVYLWSTLQPFTPFSILEGHGDKYVSDFLWLDTPEIEDNIGPPRPGHRSKNSPSFYLSRGKYYPQLTSSSEYDDLRQGLSGTWQHVLTVGKDGRCLVQSFCRGYRPISEVPPSAFAMTELSPFQKGFGSLQLIAVHQNVPSGKKNEDKICGFRRDEVTAQAPGIFQETYIESDEEDESKFEWDPSLGCLHEQRTNLELTFSTTDSGDLKELMNSPQTNKVHIAPEVIHMSRFANLYKLRRDGTDRTKAAVCRHNSNVAKNLKCAALARMWSLLASLLDGSALSGSEDLSNMVSKKGFPRNALSSSLLPTLKSLLLERADAGDVQTCVVVCEVMDVIPPHSTSSNSKKQQALSVPDLDRLLVRQWYFSYIELLQQMGLFCHATNLIRLCRDPQISKLNQQSTT